MRNVYVENNVQEMIEKIDTLSVDNLDYLLDVIPQKQIEKKRLEIAKNGEETLKALAIGTAKIGTSQDIKNYLLDKEEE